MLSVEAPGPLALFLGAGFSSIGGVPLAGQLFDDRPEVDRVTRARLVERVLHKWDRWYSRTQGDAEVYLAELARTSARDWRDAVWFVGLTVALQMGRVERVGANLTITRHNLDRTSGVPAHEQFWTTIFRITTNISVVTTNFDVLAERGLRHVPRPRVPRPGFHYGFGPEELAGGGYPSYSHIQKIKAAGRVPLLKLHGSVSWSVRNGVLVRYHDCRPAIRGDAAIVAPIVTKTVPKFFQPTWAAARKLLSRAQTWLVVGYSLPEYDQTVRSLLVEASTPSTTVHVFDPQPAVADRFRELLAINVYSHAGLPAGIEQLEDVLTRQ